MNDIELLATITKLIDTINCPSVSSIVLMGSYANGAAKIFSDIDLVRYIKPCSDPLTAAGTFIIKDTLIVVSDVSIDSIEDCFTIPEKAVTDMYGLQTAKILIDKNNFFADLQRRARMFEWTSDLQHKAYRWASEQMVGWIEEIHKGLNGLHADDIGRMLNAKFGLCWGLSRITAVINGIFLTSDNAIISDIQNHLGKESRWCELQQAAFGLSGNLTGIDQLKQDVVACLRLYLATAELFWFEISEPHKHLVERTCLRIEKELSRYI